MTRRTYIEVHPTRRVPGFLAIVWRDSMWTRCVQQVFFGRARADVEADARQYASALASNGVEDIVRRGRPQK